MIKLDCVKGMIGVGMNFQFDSQAYNITPMLP